MIGNTQIPEAQSSGRGSHFGNQSPAHVKDRIQQLDQLVHARIANAVFPGRGKRKESPEPQDIPRIE